MLVDTPINISKLRAALEGYPNIEFKNCLVQGLEQGFHTGLKYLPKQSFECKNLKSAISQPSVVLDLIQTEITKGYLCGPYTYIPYKHYRIYPIGIAEGKYSKKKRLIIDLSAPHEDKDNPSLNELIDKEEFSLHYVTIDDAIAAIKREGKGAWLIKTDITDAFKIIPIHPSLRQYHGIKWDGQFYFFKRLVFGSRSSPKIFDTLSQAVCWIAQHKYNIRNILHLLDDFLVIESLMSDAYKTKTTLLTVFHDLGIPLSSKKTEGPVHVIEYLGIYLDSINMEARLPVAKIQRILEILESFSNRTSCTKREMLSLLGHLNFACRVVRPGRSFISHLISLSTTVKKLHHHIHINKECRSDIAMWATFLRDWNGVSFFLDDNITTAADMELFTDSTRTSFGGIYRTSWFQGQFPPECITPHTSMAFSNFIL